MKVLYDHNLVDLLITFILAWLVYAAFLSIYRIYFHPLSGFPGPKIAAATLWYEAYWDVFCGGQYTFKIRELHQQYGPIVRISPNELHVNDHEFIDTVYTGSSRKTDKYDFMTGQFGNPDSAFGSVSHDLHRLRRGAMNPFFSKASIVRFEPQIKNRVLLMCHQIETNFVGSGKPIPMGKALSCTTTDIVTEYSFARSYDFLLSPSFEPNLHKAISAATQAGPAVKHFPWIGTLMRAVPIPIIHALDPEMGSFLQFQADMKTEIKAVHAQKQTKMNSPSTIFEALVYGSLPASEKSVDRLWQEGQIVIGAGTETTARSMQALQHTRKAMSADAYLIAAEVTLFYILSDREILDRLYGDLVAAMPDIQSLPNWSELENIVYLISVILTSPARASLTHTTGLSSQKAYVYLTASLDGKSYLIPAGTPVGMSAMLVHHDPKIFPDPDTFRPERWIKDDGTFDSHLNGYILSFSKGSRQCIGINLAYAELYMNLAAIIRRYGKAMRLHDTTFYQDIECVADFFVPFPRRNRGIEVKLVD